MDLKLPLSFRVVHITFLSIISVLTIVGNGLVLLSWAFHRPLRNKPHNIYLVSLAFADLLVGIIVAPSDIGTMAANQWPYSPSWCQGYILLSWLLTHVSVLHLIAISIDRYHSIFDTLSYRLRRRLPFFLRRIALIYLISGWLIYPALRDWADIGERAETFKVCTSNMSPDLSVHLAFGSYFLPILILASKYWAVYKELYPEKGGLIGETSVATGTKISIPSLTTTGQESISHPAYSTLEDGDVDHLRSGSVSTLNSGTLISGKNAGENSTQLLIRRRKAAKMLGLVIGAFCTAWFPFTVCYSILGFLPEENRTSLVIWWMPFIIGIGYANSAMNPVIYAFWNPDFRDGFKKVIYFWRK